MKKIDFMTATLAVGLVVVALATAAYFTTNAALASVELGVIGSLCAAIVFAALADRVDTLFGRSVESLAESVGRVERIEADTRRRLEAGVVAVTDKYRHDPSFWFSILRSANGKLDLVGHSLAGWVAQDFERELKTRISHILKEGGHVRLLLMDPNGDACRKATSLYGKSYHDAIISFLRMLSSLIEEYRSSIRNEHLQVRFAQDDLTYMMIDAGNDVFVSHYLSVSRAQHPLVVQVEKASGFAASYRADFEKLFDRSQPLSAAVLTRGRRA
jgi:uncharacterized membrane protein YeaQ/YmgE (transglycosylase-associated protein family)